MENALFVFKKSPHETHLIRGKDMLEHVKLNPEVLRKNDPEIVEHITDNAPLFARVTPLFTRVAQAKWGLDEFRKSTTNPQIFNVDHTPDQSIIDYAEFGKTQLITSKELVKMLRERMGAPSQREESNMQTAMLGKRETLKPDVSQPKRTASKTPALDGLRFKSKLDTTLVIVARNVFGNRRLVGYHGRDLKMHGYGGTKPILNVSDAGNVKAEILKALERTGINRIVTDIRHEGIDAACNHKDLGLTVLDSKTLTKLLPKPASKSKQAGKKALGRRDFTSISHDENMHRKWGV